LWRVRMSWRSSRPPQGAILICVLGSGIFIILNGLKGLRKDNGGLERELEHKGCTNVVWRHLD
jgi:hypothetical protein